MEEHEDLRKRVEALEKDFNFAAGKCEEGLHAVVPVVRERIVPSPDPSDPSATVVVREFFLSCPYCDKLFGLQTDVLGGIHVYEREIDEEKLAELRTPFGQMEITTLPDEGEVIEAELLDDDDAFSLAKIIYDDGEDDDEEPGGGLHRF
jgi:hypothetical protein